MIERIELDYTTRRENGLWVVNEDAVTPHLNFEVADRQIIGIPPEAFGGNHRHPRTEAFVAMGGELTLTWEDDEGNIHSEPMHSENGLLLFVIGSMVPHTVHNQGDQLGLLYEFANEKQHDVEPYNLLDRLNS